MRSMGTWAGYVTPVRTDTSRPARMVAAQPSPEYHRYETLNSQNTASSRLSLQYRYTNVIKAWFYLIAA